MTVLTEGRYGGEFVLSEASRARSRDIITIASGAGVVKPGTVLGKSSGGAAASAAKAGGNTGNGVLTMDATTPVLGTAKTGVYTVRCIAAAANGGTFRVEDPAGNVIGEVAVGATFSDDIKFAIADGATDFIVGDGFDITVTVGGKYVPSPAAAADGSDQACAINIYEVDATSADVKVAAFTRDAEVNGNCLEYAASVNDDAKKAAKHAQLAQNAGIVVR